ncbi:MAG: short-chain dehydrogenase [Frankiales bacterium]|nr:short-chain dehydrogenase [Frankiales bacterium]
MSTHPLLGTALVTGATSGLGAEFARRLAAEGRNLVLVARDAERLEAAAAELRERYLIEVWVLAADLATDDGCRLVSDRLSGRDDPIETLINNAGVGLYEPFGSVPLSRDEALLDLNVRAVQRLSHAAINAMTATGRGEIINISSVSAFLPRGAAVSYAASKAWVTAFTEGLALTAMGSGVTVGVICPGFTRTEFHARAQVDLSHLPAWMWLDAGQVVAEGLADIRGGQVVSVPTRRYRAMILLSRLLPRPLLYRVMASR